MNLIRQKPKKMIYDGYGEGMLGGRAIGPLIGNKKILQHFSKNDKNHRRIFMKKLSKIISAFAFLFLAIALIACGDPASTDNSSTNSNESTDGTTETGAYTITISSAISNGTVTADKSKANEGDTVTLTVTPDDGFKLNNFYVEYGTPSQYLLINDDYTFTMPAENVTVNASFVSVSSHSLVIVQSTNGEVRDYTFMLSGRANGTTTIYNKASGSTITLYAKPFSGYKLETFSVKDASNNDVTVTKTEGAEYTTCTFTMPDSDATVQATFTNQ